MDTSNPGELVRVDKVLFEAYRPFLVCTTVITEYSSGCINVQSGTIDDTYPNWPKFLSAYMEWRCTYKVVGDYSIALDNFIWGYSTEAQWALAVLENL